MTKVDVRQLVTCDEEVFNPFANRMSPCMALLLEPKAQVVRAYQHNETRGITHLHFCREHAKPYDMVTNNGPGPRYYRGTVEIVQSRQYVDSHGIEQRAGLPGVWVEKKTLRFVAPVYVRGL